MFVTHLKPTGITLSQSIQLSPTPLVNYHISRHKHYEELTKNGFPLRETNNTQKEVSRAWEINRKTGYNQDQHWWTEQKHSKAMQPIPATIW